MHEKAIGLSLRCTSSLFLSVSTFRLYTGYWIPTLVPENLSPFSPFRTASYCQSFPCERRASYHRHPWDEKRGTSRRTGRRTNERKRDGEKSRASENIYLLVDIKANIIPSSLLLALSLSLLLPFYFTSSSLPDHAFTLLIPPPISRLARSLPSCKLNAWRERKKKERIPCAAPTAKSNPSAVSSAVLAIPT